MGAGGRCFGSGGVGRGGGGVVEGVVGSVVVVGGGERVDLVLEFVDGAGGWSAAEVFLRVCWKRSTLPQVVGWCGRLFFWRMPSWSRRVLSPFRPPRPPERQVVNTIPLSVDVENGMPWVVQQRVKVSTTIGPVTRLWAVTESA